MSSSGVYCENNQNCININAITENEMTELTNRFTPPTNPSDYSREIGYCVHSGKEGVTKSNIENECIARTWKRNSEMDEIIGSVIDLTGEDTEMSGMSSEEEEPLDLTTINLVEDSPTIELKCNEEISNIGYDEVKFIVITPPKLDSCLGYNDICHNYTKLKTNIINYLFSNNNSNRLVVQATLDDIGVIKAEVQIRCRSRQSPTFF